ncbi:hypothetical protein ACJMK2_040780 [Sinanodonta woodiana]|uniref:Profilin n=1 Tax=Sinanodonta woodiana TaxID=1069815 RepID=A0ABD3W4X5_SINWO
MSDNQWDSHLYKLKRTGKIERAALINHVGSVLAVTPGFKLTEQEVAGILSALSHRYSHLIKLQIGQDVFTCFQHSQNTDILVGRAENDVLTIQKCNDFVVVGLADPESPGSCIHEVMTFAKRSNRKSKLTR